ncbi:MAG TPA: HIT family protein [Methylotenera sp.]|nr:HIT family protein [Methylotenera sp.]
MDVCALCVPTSHLVLWQDDFCRILLLNDADYPAYCRVELLTHTKEMTDLAPPERARMMKTVFAVELAIREIFNPDKINLASLGNKTPHLHWHVIPRFEDDKHFPNSHWGEVMRDGSFAPLNEESINDLTQKISAHIQCALSS